LIRSARPTAWSILSVTAARRADRVSVCGLFLSPAAVRQNRPHTLTPSILDPIHTPVRLVVTDVEMPVMGGVELVRSLRIVQKDLPFVALSGSVTKERQAELEGLGIKSILSKPCEAAKLLHAVHRALAE